VITGCSSGFGRATAITLARRGWHVFATIRKQSDKESLLEEALGYGCQQNLTPLFCDISDAQQIQQLAQQVKEALQQAHGTDDIPPLDALLNNAGTAYAAPLELLPIDDFHAQLDLNVTAHLAVTQALLPMIKAARGTIIFVSSISGLFVGPITSAYSVSKYAIEALGDGLRLELAPFGVRVSLIEPASSPTNIWNTSMQRSQWLNEHRNGPYKPLLTFMEKMALDSSKKGFPIRVFTDTVIRILESSRPKARYVIPRSALAIVTLRRVLPDTLWDSLVRKVLRW